MDIVRIAYFIQVGDDTIPLLPRLFRRLHHPDNVYIIHIDAKVSKLLREDVVQQVKKNTAYEKNMHIMESEMVTYKGVSMALNTIAAMTLALRVDRSWHYFINLSGADYPLVSPENQRKLLARPRVAVGYLNFITLFPQSEWNPYSFRIKLMHWDPAVVGSQDPNARLRVFHGSRDYPLERYRHYTFTKAEAWMILSRPFVKFLVRSAYAKKMLLTHIHVRSAPEHYFADVLYNHPGWRETLVPDALHKVVWKFRQRASGQHPFVLDKGHSMFTFWDYLRATRSLFARKFSKPDSLLLDRIDELLIGVKMPEGFDTSSNQIVEQRQDFFANLAAHFDSITQSTLRRQNVTWPSEAYYPLYSTDNR